MYAFLWHCIFFIHTVAPIFSVKIYSDRIMLHIYFYLRQFKKNVTVGWGIDFGSLRYGWLGMALGNVVSSTGEHGVLKLDLPGWNPMISDSFRRSAGWLDSKI